MVQCSFPTCSLLQIHTIFSLIFKITKALKEKREHKSLKSKEDSGNQPSKLAPTTVRGITSYVFRLIIIASFWQSNIYPWLFSFPGRSSVKNRLQSKAMCAHQWASYRRGKKHCGWLKPKAMHISSLSCKKWKKFFNAEALSDSPECTVWNRRGILGQT